MTRELCDHYHEFHNCKECDSKPKLNELILSLLLEYGWVSSEQTEKEFVNELEERIRRL